MAAEVLNRLLQNSVLFRLQDGAQATSLTPSASASMHSSGFAEIDAVLAGGWPCPGFVELLTDAVGAGELMMWLPVQRQLRMPVLWVHTQAGGVLSQAVPYAPSLAAHGIDLSQLALVRTNSDEQTLWAVEQALLSRSMGLVLAMLHRSSTSFTALQRLAHALQGSNTLCVLIRPTVAAQQASPARIRFVAKPERIGALSLSFIKRKGMAGSVTVTIKPNVMPCLSHERVLLRAAQQRERNSMRAQSAQQVCLTGPSLLSHSPLDHLMSAISPQLQLSPRLRSPYPSR
jgi:protein ImuA